MNRKSILISIVFLLTISMTLPVSAISGEGWKEMDRGEKAIYIMAIAETLLVIAQWAMTQPDSTQKITASVIVVMFSGAPHDEVRAYIDDYFLSHPSSDEVMTAYLEFCRGQTGSTR